MKFRGDFLGQPSGSLGGITFSHNKGGYYIRKRNIPTNPSSARQQVVRAGLGTLASSWAGLTQAKQDAWNLYASNVPMPDRLGEMHLLTGLQHYIRSNSLLLQSGLALNDAAPTTFDTGTFTPVIFSALTQSTQKVSCAYTNTDDWANEDNSYLFISVSKPMGSGRNFCKGPYRLAGLVAGDSETPPTSPELVTLPFVFDVGNKGWFQVRVLRADGRLSMIQNFGPLVTV